jgi:hypothetical protein
MARDATAEIRLAVGNACIDEGQRRVVDLNAAAVTLTSAETPSPPLLVT